MSDKINKTISLYCGMCAWKTKSINDINLSKIELQNTFWTVDKEKHENELFSQHLHEMTLKYDSVGIFKRSNYVTPNNNNEQNFINNNNNNNNNNNTSLLLNDSSLDYGIIEQRIKQENSNNFLIKEFEPLRVKLLCKKMLRSKKDYDNGKMSILVQPKTNPLEGDSSMRIQRGKWWMKDMSAIFEIPTIIVTKYPLFDENINNDILKFTISNPKEVSMTVRLSFTDLSIKSTESLQQQQQQQQQQQKYEELLILKGIITKKSFHNKITIRNELINEVIEFTLDGYEDELLRDDDDQVSSPISTSTTNSAKITNNNNNLKDENINTIQFEVKHNIGYVSIPIQKPIQDNNESEVVLDLFLTIFEEENNENIFSTKVKIVIPFLITF